MTENRKTLVTADTAKSVLALIASCETPAAAAHQVRIGLEAIRPYTDRSAEAVLFILNQLAARENIDKPLAQLRTIAEGVR